MGFGEFLSKVKNGLVSNSEIGSLRAGEDKVLLGLRRQRQRQLDGVEKEELKVSIARFEKDRVSKELFGLKKDGPKRKMFGTPKDDSFYQRGRFL